MSIDASELIGDPDFTEAFTIQRQTAAQIEGETVTTSATTDVTGVVQPASPQEIKALPEGDRLTNVFIFWSKTEIKATLGSPDILLARGGQYRVIKVEPRQGYWKAFAEGFQP